MQVMLMMLVAIIIIALSLMRAIGCPMMSGSIASCTTVPQLLMVVGIVIGLVLVVLLVEEEEVGFIKQEQYRHVGIAKCYFVGKAPKRNVSSKMKLK